MEKLGCRRLAGAAIGHGQRAEVEALRVAHFDDTANVLLESSINPTPRELRK